jgi:hypothetical protein
MENLFRAFDVWRRADGYAVRYRCFQLVDSGKFTVQSADFYRLPSSPEQVLSLDRQFLELFIEQGPDERSSTFATLEEAIAHHEREFGRGRIDVP